MAKKKEEKVIARTLEKTMGGILGQVGASDAVTIAEGNGWNHVFQGGQHFFNKIEYFDLSGYSLDDRTTFIQGVLFQDMTAVPIGMGVANMYRVTICSTTPLDIDDLTIMNSQNHWQPPGTLSSKHSLSQIVRARFQTYLTLSTYAGLQLINTDEWGSADSTAADKLYVASAFVVPNVEGAGFGIPDQNFVLPVLVAEEPELEYIMRLARSTQTIYRDKGN